MGTVHDLIEAKGKAGTLAFNFTGRSLRPLPLHG